METLGLSRQPGKEIADEDIDKNLKYKLRAEYPAILRWAVDGALIWQREGLKMPKAVEDAVSEYKSEMDVISAFVEDELMLTDGEVRSSELYHRYSEWASENNQYKMSSTKFGTEFGKKFEKIPEELRDKTVPTNITPYYNNKAHW